MTATDELRALLDERGVEWKNETAFMQGQEHLMTTWKSTNGKAVAYSEFEYPHMKKLRIYDCTPEQAVEATLGPREQPPYDELIEALRRDWDIEASWDGLRRFWYVGLTDEGVRKRDEREATLGRGTCHEVIVDEYLNWRGCGNCGYVWEYMYGIGKCTRPNFCPRCGAKVVSA